MKKIPFYLLTNKLYTMSFKNYLNYLKQDILSSSWFKENCKNKNIKVKVLSKDYCSKETKNCYFIYKEEKIYFYKLFLLKFEYKKEIKNNYHLKLLNINIKHETLFNLITMLFSSQKLFLDTGHYPNINFLDRKLFIETYVKKYNSYLDLSVLSKILNNTHYEQDGYIYKLSHLFPKKTFIYSLYIKILLSTQIDLKNDFEIAKQLFEIYNVKISRRTVCDIRNKYLIPNIKKIEEKNLTLYFNNFNNNRRLLNKENISTIENNLKGVYELSSNEKNFYPFAENKVIYIGSSNNLKKRLKTYTSKTAHTNDIKNFIKDNEKIYFRIIKTFDYQEHEKELIDAFINLYGDLPRLNTQRILKEFIIAK